MAVDELLAPALRTEQKKCCPACIHLSLLPVGLHASSAYQGAACWTSAHKASHSVVAGRCARISPPPCTLHVSSRYSMVQYS